MLIGNYRLTLRQKPRLPGTGPRQIIVGPVEFALFLSGILVLAVEIAAISVLQLDMDKDLWGPLFAIAPAVLMAFATTRIAKKKILKIALDKLDETCQQTGSCESSIKDNRDV